MILCVVRYGMAHIACRILGCCLEAPSSFMLYRTLDNTHPQAAACSESLRAAMHLVLIGQLPILLAALLRIV